MATLEGRIDNIKRLLKRGFKINSKMDQEKQKGTTALYCAAERGHAEVRSDAERGGELSTPSRAASFARVRSIILIPGCRVSWFVCACVWSGDVDYLCTHIY